MKRWTVVMALLAIVMMGTVMAYAVCGGCGGGSWQADAASSCSSMKAPAPASCAMCGKTLDANTACTASKATGKGVLCCADCAKKCAADKSACPKNMTGNKGYIFRSGK